MFFRFIVPSSPLVPGDEAYAFAVVVPCNAPGLKIIERIARKLSRDVWVVAPEMEQR
jgi:aromatic ring hydroxylase